MLGGIVGAISTVASNVASIGGSSAAGSPEYAKIIEAFEKEAAKSPEERARESVLKSHHLSELDYQRLSPEERKAIDAEIRVAVRTVTEQRVRVSRGTLSSFTSIA